tara:strand:- start:277 stop:453 length:177 start_codon:yes stop_codon:yes gene_type:complete
MCIVTDGSIIARRNIKRKGLKTMKFKDLVIIVVGLILTPFTLIIVGIIELKRWLKKER